MRDLARRREARQLDFFIEIDGGVGLENIAEVVRAGVDWVVAGSSVFGTDNPAAAAADMQKSAREAFGVEV